jgi:MFS family permease
MNGHHHFFHFLKNRELNELYASIALRAFAISMTGIFIPIYLYQLGYSFSQIFLFFGLTGLFHALFVFPASKVSSKLGLKHSMFASMPFLILFFLLLYALENYSIPLVLLALPLGISTSMFWVSYHSDFSRVSTKDHRGSEVGISQILAAIFSVIGPIVGGFILLNFGFSVLFILVSFLLLGSIMPLFMSHELHQPMEFSLKGFFRGQRLRDVFTFVGYGAEMRLGTVVWPLFIFIFILSEQYVSLGLVSSLALFVALIFTFASGKISDTHNKKKMFRLGVIFTSVVWAVKSFIVTPLQVFVVDGFYGASQAITHVPFDTMNYERAKKHDIMKTIARREFFVHFGAFLLFMTLMFFTESLTEVFRYGGSFSSLIRFFF